MQTELDELLKQEELFWFQQSREEWIVSGDRNTKFYHASLLAKKKRVQVIILKNSDGSWVNDHEQIKRMVQNFYTSLFAAKGVCDTSLLSKELFRRLNPIHQTRE